MTLKSLVIFVGACILTIASHGQNENSVDIIPLWNNNESYAVKIKSSTTDQKNDKTQNYFSTFDAHFTVKEVSDDGYKVEWIYTNANLSDNEPVIENQIVAKLLNTKLLIKFSDIGRFEELINSDEVMLITNKAIDELIANSTSDPTMNTQYKIAKQLVETKQGLEIAILKQIKFYHFSFGYNYSLNFVQTNDMKLPNPVGGLPFDAVEKVQLTKIDNENSVCIIETSKCIEAKKLKNAIVEYVKKATNSDPRAIDEISKAKLEFSEHTMQQIDFTKGLIQKSFFKRVINLGFQNRSHLLEIETVGNY